VATYSQILRTASLLNVKLVAQQCEKYGHLKTRREPSLVNARVQEVFFCTGAHLDSNASGGILYVA
jgi:hypothetical protein